MKKYYAIRFGNGEVEDIDSEELACWDKYKDGSRWRLRELSLDEFISQMKADGIVCEPVYVIPVKEYEGMVATNNMNVNELRAMRQARQTFQTHSFD